MTRKSVAKGKTGEREVASLFRAAMHNAETALGYTHSWSAGIKRASYMAAADGGSDVVGIPNLCVEVKNAKVLRISEWFKQARTQALHELGSEDYALLVYKVPRKGWRVMYQPKGTIRDMPLSEFLVEVYVPWYSLVFLPSRGIRHV